jgi:hypothetical protein
VPVHFKPLKKWLENQQKTFDLSQVTEKLYHIVLYREHLTLAGFELTTFVVIGTDCTGSWKANYHTYDQGHGVSHKNLA